MAAKQLNLVGNRLASLWNAQTAPPPKTPASAPEKQYLRLPVESARKLRWYDKGDVQAMVKAHVHEKRELNEAIGVLKRLLIRSGLSDVELDLELSHVLTRIDDIKESDDGVNEVLLMSVHSELEGLQVAHAKLQEELEAMRTDRGQEDESWASTSFTRNGTGAGLSRLSSMVKSVALPQLDPQLLSGLMNSVSEIDSYLSASSSLSRKIRSCEMDVSVAQATESMRLLAQQALAREQQAPAAAAAAGSEANASADPDVHEAGSSHWALAGKLERLEAERRLQAQESLDLLEQLQLTRSLAAQAEPLRQLLSQAEERCSCLQADASSLQSDLDAARAACRAAEAVSDRRGAELKKLQQSTPPGGAEQLRKYQDICLEYEERASTAERRGGLAEARCGKLEAALREAQAQAKALQRQLAVARGELVETQAKLAAAEAASAASVKDRQNAEAAEHLQQAEQTQAKAHEELLAARAATVVLEQRLQAADIREARLMSEMRVLDLAVGDQEELQAQVVTLRDKLTDQGAERGQLEHYRQVVREFEAGQDRAQEELLVTAQLVTQLEARLSGALSRVDAAETSTQVAEGRARMAEAGIGAEVELRLTAACSNRGLWPQPIRDEFDRLEQRLGSFQTSLVAAQGQLQAGSDQHRADVVARAKLSEEIDILQSRGASQADELASLRSALEARDDELAAAEEQLRALHLECDDIKRQRNAASSALMQRATSSSELSPGNARWQVQNKVGGGGLYGIAERGSSGGAGLERKSSTHSSGGLPLPQLTQACSTTSRSHSNSSLGSLAVTGNVPDAAAAAATDGGGARVRTKMEGVDIVYLKNVLLKFMDATVTGRVAERDVLLPAVAALLQASPAEFSILKRMFVNTTTPPAMQMLSALGFKLS